MLNPKQRQTGLTYLMAVAMTAAPVFHIGDTIEIETLLNGRTDKNFLSDQESIRRYVSTQLPKGTLGEVEQVHQFKARKGSKQGNTGLYIKVTSGPNAGKSYWVLYRPDQNYLKLYDRQAKETSSVDQAKNIETRRDINAVQDRQPAQAQPEATESEAVQEAIDLSEFIKDAGEAPKVECQTQTETLKSDAGVPHLPENATFYLRNSERVQTDAPQIQELARQLTQEKTDDLSKAMAIHDWVASNVSYDTDAYYNEYLKNKPFSRKYDALSVLTSKPSIAICSGYANLTIALLRSSNIPTREVEGLLHVVETPAEVTCDTALKMLQADKSAVVPGWHGWIEAWINGAWVPMDTTADAGTVSTDTHTFTRSPSQKFMDLKVFDASHTKCQINDYY